MGWRHTLLARERVAASVLSCSSAGGARIAPRPRAAGAASCFIIIVRLAGNM
eukprot:COSAG03_NODE_26260_length_260_cov_0.645963_1_plen_51_part_01